MEAEQLSLAVALPVFDGAVDALQLTVTFDGQLTTGLVVSKTVTVAVPEALLFEPSVTLSVTVFAPVLLQLKVNDGDVPEPG